MWEDAYQGGRYFLVENRNATGFDQDIYGSGFLIWHCNEEICFDNSDDNFRLLDLEEADGLNQLDNKTSWMDGGDVYPGTSSKTVFDDASNPNAHDVFGAATGVQIFDIAVYPFNVVGGCFEPRTLDGYTISYHSHTPLWGWGFLTPEVNHGAVIFNIPDDGEIFAVQAGVHENTPTGYTARVYNTWSGGPSGLLSTTSGSFPNYPSDRYHEINLPAPLAMLSGEDFVVDISWGPDDWAVPYTVKSPISGQSYFSSNGTTWYHWTTRDVLIRGRVRYPFTCYCGEKGDVDGSGGAPDPLDVTFLVNRVFKSQYELCDRCSP